MSFKLNSKLIYYLNNMENQLLKQADICVPIYNNNQSFMELKYKLSTMNCCCKKKFELINKNNEWELILSNEKKYYFIANNSEQFCNILLNLGIEEQKYKIIAFDTNTKKKINSFRSNNLNECIQWCLDTDRDMKNVRYVY